MEFDFILTIVRQWLQVHAIACIFCSVVTANFPGLYLTSEVESIIAQLNPCQSQLSTDRVDLMMRQFVQRVKQWLHVIVLLRFSRKLFSAHVLHWLSEFLCLPWIQEWRWNGVNFKNNRKVLELFLKMRRSPWKVWNLARANQMSTKSRLIVSGNRWKVYCLTTL